MVAANAPTCDPSHTRASSGLKLLASIKCLHRGRNLLRTFSTQKRRPDLQTIEHATPQSKFLGTVASTLKLEEYLSATERRKDEFPLVRPDFSAVALLRLLPGNGKMTRQSKTMINLHRSCHHSALVLLVLISLCSTCEAFTSVVLQKSSSSTSSCIFQSSVAAPAESDEDDDETDPWVLRSVTFACLDGSPSSPDPQLLADYLMEMGACSTAITDHDRDTDKETPIFREPGEDVDFDNEDWSTAETAFNAKNQQKAALICGDAAVGTNVWNRCDVTAHIPAMMDIVQLAEGIRTAFELASVPRYTVDEIPDVDWVVKVQSAWKPIVAHGFVLRFPWHKEEDVNEAIDNCDDDLPLDEYATITLQGGIAFGTGEHPTTRLCLKFLKDILTIDGEKESDEESPTVRKLLDYGSGSGVLGLAACSLSPGLSAVGIDIDADAVAIANANAEINGLSMVSYLPAQKVIDNGDAESASVMMRGAAANAVETLPSDLDGPIFDACAANILAGPLIGLASTLAGMVKRGGKIGLSGILEAQAQNVVTAYSEFFEDVEVAGSEGGWVLITGRKAN